MSRVRSRGNKDTELALAKLLRRHGITGWRRQVNLTVSSRRPVLRSSTAEGGRKETHFPKQDSVRVSSPRLLRVKPDFVFRQARLAVFVDGCFWHGCPKHATKPANNKEFWKKKLAGNQTRDRLVTRTLRRAGWHVFRIWECELTRMNETRLLQRLKSFLKR